MLIKSRSMFLKCACFGYILVSPYSAPETMFKDTLTMQSDIWSLGCVFLEIWSVLKGKTLNDLKKYLGPAEMDLYLYTRDIDTIASWCEDLIGSVWNVMMDQPSLWIKSMLREKPEDRMSIGPLLDLIAKTSGSQSSETGFIGSCCMEEVI